MRILVCGGRTFGLTADERIFVMRCLEQFAVENSIHFNPDDNWLPSDIFVIAGGAKGVDTLAIEWAVVNWLEFKEFPADWKMHGKAAGHIRNKQMLDEGKPDIVLAFPGGRGTSNMVKQARERQIPVKEYQC